MPTRGIAPKMPDAVLHAFEVFRTARRIMQSPVTLQSGRRKKAWLRNVEEIHSRKKKKT